MDTAWARIAPDTIPYDEIAPRVEEIAVRDAEAYDGSGGEALTHARADRRWLLAALTQLLATPPPDPWLTVADDEDTLVIGLAGRPPAVAMPVRLAPGIEVDYAPGGHPVAVRLIRSVLLQHRRDVPVSTTRATRPHAAAPDPDPSGNCACGRAPWHPIHTQQNPEAD